MFIACNICQISSSYTLFIWLFFIASNTLRPTQNLFYNNPYEIFIHSFEFVNGQNIAIMLFHECSIFLMAKLALRTKITSSSYNHNSSFTSKWCRALCQASYVFTCSFSQFIFWLSIC